MLQDALGLHSESSSRADAAPEPPVRSRGVRGNREPPTWRDQTVPLIQGNSLSAQLEAARLARSTRARAGGSGRPDDLEDGPRPRGRTATSRTDRRIHPVSATSRPARAHLPNPQPPTLGRPLRPRPVLLPALRLLRLLRHDDEPRRGPVRARPRGRGRDAGRRVPRPRAAPDAVPRRRDPVAAVAGRPDARPRGRAHALRRVRPRGGHRRGQPRRPGRAGTGERGSARPAAWASRACRSASSRSSTETSRS